MDEFGPSDPSVNADTQNGWAESVRANGWLMTALIAATLLIVLAPTLAMPDAWMRFLYLVPAFALWWTQLPKLMHRLSERRGRPQGPSAS